VRVLIGPGMAPVNQGGQFAGGAAMATYEIARSLSELGHEVYLATLHDFTGSSDQTLHILRRRKLREFLKASPRIALKLFKGERNVEKYYGRPSLLEEARFLGVRLYWKKLIDRVKPDIISIHGNNLDRLPMILSAVESGAPFVFTSHGISEEEEVKYDLKVFLEDFFGFLKSNEIPVISVSSGLRSKIIDDIGYKSELCTVIGNGISHEFLEKASRYKEERVKEKGNAQSSEVKLITVGSLIKRKNQLLVMEAMKHLPEKYKYVVVGDGPERKNLERFANSNGLASRVDFAGRLLGEELIQAYSECDVFALTSTSEAFGLVFLEALACGLPVVTMEDLEGVKDIYQPDCFELVEEYDSVELAEAIVKSTRKIGREQMMEHVKKFSWEKVGTQYNETLSSVADQNHS